LYLINIKSLFTLTCNSDSDTAKKPKRKSTNGQNSKKTVEATKPKGRQTARKGKKETESEEESDEEGSEIEEDEETGIN